MKSIVIFCIISLISKISGYYEVFFSPYYKAYNYNYAQKRNIENSINKTVEPCENFYEYACGNYIYDNNHENYQEITQYLDSKFNKKLLEAIRPEGLVEEFIKKVTNFFAQPKQTFEEKMQNYFVACSCERKGNFWKYLKELKINWPLLKEELHAKSGLSYKELKPKDFWHVLGLLHSYNCRNLIMDYQINSNVDGFLELAFKPIFYEVSNILPEDEFIYAFLRLLDVADSQAVVQQLKLTQKNWLEIFKNHTQAEEETQGLSCVEFLAEYSYFNDYLKSLLGRKINDITKVTLIYPAYFKYFLDIEWSGKEVEQQLTFLMIQFFYYLALDGTTGYTPLACVKDMREKFHLASNYVYYQRVLRNEKRSYKQALNEMKNKILTTFEHYLQESSLNISSLEVLELKNKFFNITFNLGNLPYPMDFQTIDNFYLQLPNLDDRNYFRNHLLLLKHRFLNSLQPPTDLNIYLAEDMKPLLASSPYYVLEQNMIVIPLASLQYPLFHYDYTNLYQLSLMGFVMSHEVGHVFDNTILITPELTKCLENQQSTDDMDERIADIMAERVVYRTYEKYYADADNQMWQRLFYLNMAQFFCNKGDLEFRNHDADVVRLQQIVKNSPQFAEAFECALDTPMNPKEKCRLF